MSTSTIDSPRLRDYTKTLEQQHAALDAARYIRCVVRAKGDVMAAALAFETLYPRSLHRELVTKAAVAPGTRTDVSWAGPLAARNPMTDAIVALARAASVLGAIPYREVPFGTTTAVQTTGAVATWIGEGATKRVGKQGYVLAAVDPAKVAVPLTISVELARSISPAADAVIRDDLVGAIGTTVDGELLDETHAPVSGVRPGSILNGIAPLPPSGTDKNAAALDAEKTIARYAAGSAITPRTRILMPANTAVLIKSARPLEALTATGGSYCGIPAIVSDNVGARIVVVDGGQLLVADDGATIDTSRQAAIQMDDAPDSPPGAATVLVSLWQNNLIGILGERFVSWKLARPSAVAWCGPTAYTF